MKIGRGSLQENLAMQPQGESITGLKKLPVSPLVKLMVGRRIKQVFPEINTQTGRLLLDIKNLNLANPTVNNVSIQVHAGEVVGIAGLVGSGKSAIGRACFGLNKIRTGQIYYLDDLVFDNGQRINDLSPRAMLDRGMLYLPSDRRVEGLVMMQNVRENVSLPSLGMAKFSSGFLLKRQRERDIVGEVARRLGMNPVHIEKPLELLSGGNQQKVLVAKSLVRDVKLFILDEPTVGVDIGARAAILELPVFQASIPAFICSAPILFPLLLPALRLCCSPQDWKVENPISVQITPCFPLLHALLAGSACSEELVVYRTLCWAQYLSS